MASRRIKFVGDIKYCRNCSGELIKYGCASNRKQRFKCKKVMLLLLENTNTRLIISKLIARL